MNETKQEKQRAYYQANKQAYRERYLIYKSGRKLDPKKQAEHNRKAREWKRKRLADPEYAEAVRAKKREYERRRLMEAKSDPVKLADLRAKRWSGTKKWIEKVKGVDPARASEWAERDRDQARRQRAKPGYWDRANAYSRNRRRIDPAYRLSQSMRNTIAGALRGRYKHGTFVELVGCTAGELVRYLEGQFKESMSWSNYGSGCECWCVDHKVPCAAFDLNDPEQQKLCFHYTNLQPMWFLENSSKSSRHEGKFHRHKLSSAQ